MTGDCCVFKFFRRSVDGKYLMSFHSETSVFKFLPRSVDEASTHKYLQYYYRSRKYFLPLDLNCKRSHV